MCRGLWIDAPLLALCCAGASAEAFAALLQAPIADPFAVLDQYFELCIKQALTAIDRDSRVCPKTRCVCVRVCVCVCVCGCVRGCVLTRADVWRQCKAGHKLSESETRGDWC